MPPTIWMPISKLKNVSNEGRAGKEPGFLCCEAATHRVKCRQILPGQIWSSMKHGSFKRLWWGLEGDLIMSMKSWAIYDLEKLSDIYREIPVQLQRPSEAILQHGWSFTNKFSCQRWYYPSCVSLWLKFWMRWVNGIYNLRADKSEFCSIWCVFELTLDSNNRLDNNKNDHIYTRADEARRYVSPAALAVTPFKLASSMLSMMLRQNITKLLFRIAQVLDQVSKVEERERTAL